MHRINKQRGMTLIECLVALAIASLIAVMLVSLVSYITRLNTHRDHRLQASVPIHQMAVLLDHDISSMLPFAIHWRSGDRSAMIDVGDQRWCWTTLSQRYQAKQSWHRVCYQLNENILSRMVWPAGDHIAHEDGHVTNQWKGIDSLTIRFLGKEKKRLSNRKLFWPHVWAWEIITEQGQWNGAALVRAWPRRSA